MFCTFQTYAVNALVSVWYVFGQMSARGGEYLQGQRILTRDLLYQAIRDAVICGELPPGSRVTEMQLAQQFGMSRTPLREAITRLEAEQLLSRMPNGALTITSLDMMQLSEIFDIHERIEGLVIASLARRKDEEVVHHLDAILRQESALIDATNFRVVYDLDRNFHDVLWDHGRQSQAVAILQGFVGLIERYQHLAPVSKSITSRRVAICNEHTVMRNAIAEGDPVWAELALKTHVRNSKRFLQMAYKNSAPNS